MLAALANDQAIMRAHPQDEQPLIRIQYDWAEARVKGKQDPLVGKFVLDGYVCKTERPKEGGRSVNHFGLGKMIAGIYP